MVKFKGKYHIEEFSESRAKEKMKEVFKKMIEKPLREIYEGYTPEFSVKGATRGARGDDEIFVVECEVALSGIIIQEKSIEHFMLENTMLTELEIQR